MLKVVIADDEPFVREGLKSLIDWEKIGVKLVGDFENVIARYSYYGYPNAVYKWIADCKIYK